MKGIWVCIYLPRQHPYSLLEHREPRKALTQLFDRLHEFGIIVPQTMYNFESFFDVPPTEMFSISGNSHILYPRACMLMIRSHLIGVRIFDCVRISKQGFTSSVKQPFRKTIYSSQSPFLRIWCLTACSWRPEEAKPSQYILPKLWWKCLKTMLQIGINESSMRRWDYLKWML